MINFILSYLNSEISKDKLYEKLKKEYGITKNEFLCVMYNLEVNEKVYYNKNKNTYKKFPQGYHVAEIKVNSRGKAYFEIDGKKIYITPEELNGALLYDIVVIESTNFDYSVKKILDRSESNLVCEYQLINGKNRAVPLDENFKRILYVTNLDDYDLNYGDIVLVKPSNKISKKRVRAKVERIICTKDDPNKEETIINAKFGLRTNFNEKVKKETKVLKEKRYDFLNEDRVDLRSENVFSIDHTETLDVDDAVSIKKENDNYVLKVHVAHQSKNISIYSEIFKDALVNTASIYTKSAYENPLFPFEISRDMFSLVEGEDRPARTFEITYDKDGNIINSKIYQSIINNKHKMSTKKVDNFFKTNNLVKEYEDCKEDLLLVKELTLKILKRKSKEVNKSKSYYDMIVHKIESQNREIKLKRKEDITSIIIETLMIETNNLASINGAPIFRNHTKLNEDLIIEEVNNHLEKNGSLLEVSSLKEIYQKYNDPDVKHAIKFVISNKKNKAFWSTVNSGHESLKLDGYAQVTSELRRLGDFINHYTLDLIDKGLYTPETEKKLKIYYNEICKRLNKQKSKTELVMNYLSKIYETNLETFYIKDIIDDYVCLCNDEEDLVVAHLNHFINGNCISIDGKIYDQVNDIYYSIYDKVLGKQINKETYGDVKVAHVHVKK